MYSSLQMSIQHTVEPTVLEIFILLNFVSEKSSEI